ncbi:MAG: hypothetical protein K0R66_1606 [Gammaproteobacteria bacterium]|nr:hypothetical protein [Gammaproteobacteria bacterium]
MPSNNQPEYYLVPIGPDAGDSLLEEYSGPANTGDTGAQVTLVKDKGDEWIQEETLPEHLQKYCSCKSALVFAGLMSTGMGLGYVLGGLAGLGYGAVTGLGVFGIGKKCAEPRGQEFNGD